MPPEHILRCGDKNFPDCGKEIFDKGEFDGFACFTEYGWLLEIPMNRKKSGLGPCVRSRFVWNGTFGKAERDDVRLFHHIIDQTARRIQRQGTGGRFAETPDRRAPRGVMNRLSAGLWERVETGALRNKIRRRVRRAAG